MAVSKEQEIAILRETAQRLGPCSYMGPWLTESLPWLADAIACDVFPRSIESAHKTAEQIKQRGRDEAEVIVNDALIKAADIVRRAEADAQRIRERQHACLHSTIKALEALR